MTSFGDGKDTLDVEFGHLFAMERLDEAIAEAVEVHDRIRENLQSTFSEKTAIYQRLYVQLCVAFNTGYLILTDPQSTVAEKAETNRKLDVLMQRLNEVIAVAREVSEVRSGRYIDLVSLLSIVVEKTEANGKLDDLLPLFSDSLDRAISSAVEVLDRTKGNPNASVAEKAAAQYNLGSLYSDKARFLFSTEAGTDLKPYIDASRNAASTFFAVASITAPVEKADKQTVIPYVQNSLFQAGQIYYSVGIGVKLPQDLTSALTPLTTFVSYADKGVFPQSGHLRQNTETVLNYLAAANFELGQMQVTIDGELSEKAVNYFLAAGDVFRDMVRRYPNALKSAFWQYRVGESHYTAQQFEKAIDEYDKVRSVNKYHKSVPESLFALSTCAQLLIATAEKTGDETAKQHWYNRLFKANEILVNDYPSSPYIEDVRAIIRNVKANKLKVRKPSTRLGNIKLAPASGESPTHLQGWFLSPDFQSIVVSWKESQINLEKHNVNLPKTVSMQPQQIARKVLASTVLVVIEDAYGKELGFGSGFFICQNQIVSNWHVVEGAATGYAMQVTDGITYNIKRITAKNVKQDLVILEVSGIGDVLPLGNSNEIQIGDPIYAAGNPKGWTGTFSEGIISGFQIQRSGKRFQISAPVSPGSSGSPLLNNKGEVIGIVYAKHSGIDAENLNLAIPVNYLKNLFK